MSGSALSAAAALLLQLVLGTAAAAQQEGQEEQQEDQQEEVTLGRSSADHFQQTEEPEQVELRRRSRLRLAPVLTSPVLEVVPERVSVPLLDRHEDWIRVRYGIWKGWVLEEGRDTGPMMSPVPITHDPVPLDRAREIMGEGAREGTLGPYPLLTDLRDDRLVEPLEAVVAGLDEAYRERFGLDPGPPRGEAIVIFARERDYRTFEREDLRLAGLETLGHTTPALMTPTDSPEEAVIATLTVTFAGRRNLEELREIVVHELTHMLNRRALGPLVPAWLEEGLAEDLAYCRVDSDGRLELGSMGGTSKTVHYFWARDIDRLRTTVTGSRAALAALLSAWRTPYRPELDLLAELSWQMLVEPASRPLLYAQSAFLTRYLLDAGGDESAQRFRAYLAAVADGELAADTLWNRLGTPAADLEEDFYLWLRRQAAAYGLEVPRR